MKNTDKKIVKESYEISDELAERLNSILADEFIAAQFYRLAELAMKGKKQHLLTEIAKKNGEDELEDHFKNLSEWMQSKGLRVVTNYNEMLDITNGTVFEVEDGDSTERIVDMLIQSEEEAIEAYESIIPDTDYDLHTMLCGFLKDEREHLKELNDCKDEMGSHSDEKKKVHPIFEGKHNESRYEGYPYKVSHIKWDVDDPDELADLPKTLVVDVPEEVVADDGEEEYISDYLSDEYGFCHNGFLYDAMEDELEIYESAAAKTFEIDAFVKFGKTYRVRAKSEKEAIMKVEAKLHDLLGWPTPEAEEAMIDEGFEALGYSDSEVVSNGETGDEPDFVDNV